MKYFTHLFASVDGQEREPYVNAFCMIFGFSKDYVKSKLESTRPSPEVISEFRIVQKIACMYKRHAFFEKILENVGLSLSLSSLEQQFLNAFSNTGESISDISLDELIEHVRKCKICASCLVQELQRHWYKNLKD